MKFIFNFNLLVLNIRGAKADARADAKADARADAIKKRFINRKLNPFRPRLGPLYLRSLPDKP